jgi:PAS domain S-box-containing protein
LQDLRRSLSSCQRDQFYSSLVASLAGVAGVPLAFLASLSVEPAPALRSLAFGGSDWSAGDARSRAPMNVPRSLLADADPAQTERRLRDWLLASGWLPPVDPGDVMLRLLRGCDEVPIGILGVDVGCLNASSGRHVGLTLEAFANLAERVLERDGMVAALEWDRSQLQAVVDSALDAIVVADEKLRAPRANGAAGKMFPRKAADAIRQSFDRRVGIFIVQGQRFRYLDPYMVQLLGCEDADELLDRLPLIELIVPGQRARVTAAMRECLSGPHRSMREQIRMLRRDGGVIVVQMHGRTFELDGRPALVGVALDVTGRGCPADVDPA